MTTRSDPWSIRTLEPGDVPACERLLARLPDWFGLEAQNRAYVESLSLFPAVVALQDGEIAGFLALEQHTPESVEIHVMAVEPRLHRKGIGGALAAWAERWCREHDVRWLHVKTRGPATPDPHYERTRRFYLALGFEPLFESLTLWGPEDAALILVKTVESPE
jgi:GNAT superfamily N-acetyltransferase